MHRRLAELDRLDRLYGLGALPTGVPRHRTRRSHGGFWPSMLVTLVVLVGLLVFVPGVTTYRIQALVGLGNDRLHGVVDTPRGQGAYRFTRTQPGSEEPVSYNPCRSIEYVVNPTGAPDGYLSIVAQAATEVSRASGFEFEYVGPTTDRDFLDRGATSLSSSPVLIGWATSAEVPGLAGEVAGLGGSAAVQRTPDHLSYTTGMVALDQDVFAQLASSPDGLPEARAIVMHELGHVVGLAHVEDPTELMYGDNLGRTSFGPGDLEGLARLGAVDCL